MQDWHKRAAGAVLSVPAWLLVALYRLGLMRFETGSCGLALIPGAAGVWLRRCWYRRTLRRCGRALCVNWMAIIYRPETGVGDNVYLGPFTSVINADLGDDVMLGTRVSVAQGARQHGTERIDIPMSRQTGQPHPVRIGNDVWVGTGAVILADVATGCVVGAGAVVTRTFDPCHVLVGVPARPTRKRG